MLNAVIDRMGILTVVERLPGSKYRCVCDCGNEKIVCVGHFRAGNYQSCGCHARRHGHCSREVRSRTYTSYHNMIARCHKKTNKRYKDYGMKGIVVCDRWRQDFRNFLQDMGECPDGLTIDRRDNRRGYLPDNCHWVTRSKNQRNRKDSIVWVVNGKSYYALRDAADAYNVSTNTISAWCKGRIAAGRAYPKKERCYAFSKYSGHEVAV